MKRYKKNTSSNILGRHRLMTTAAVAATMAATMMILKEGGKDLVPSRLGHSFIWSLFPALCRKEKTKIQQLKENQQFPDGWQIPFGLVRCSAARIHGMNWSLLFDISAYLESSREFFWSRRRPCHLTFVWCHNSTALHKDGHHYSSFLYRVVVVLFRHSSIFFYFGNL